VREETIEPVLRRVESSAKVEQKAACRCHVSESLPAHKTRLKAGGLRRGIEPSPDVIYSLTWS
jgi:hypothetical protein